MGEGDLGGSDTEDQGRGLPASVCDHARLVFYS